LDVPMIAVMVIVGVFIACVIAYGVWLRKGEKEEASKITKK